MNTIPKKQNIINRLMAPENLIKDNVKLGNIPSSKEAYSLTATLALPALIEMVFIALINVINTMMVGGLGSYAITAVGLTAQPKMLILSVFSAMNIGITAVVSRSKGADMRDDANLCLVQALLFASLLSMVAASIGYMAAEPLMRLAGAGEDTIYFATSYFRVICISVPPQVIALAISAAQRGIGQTKLTLRINLTANLVNILLNFLLIEGRFGLPRLEITGSAIGVLAGQCCGFLLALQSILQKNGYLTIRKRPLSQWKFNMYMLKNISQISSGAMLEQLVQRFGFTLFSRLVADLGTDIYAAHQIGSQLMNLTFTFGDGLSVASTSLVGQNIGKKRPDLSITYGKICQRLAFLASCCMFIIIMLLRKQFVVLFSDEPYILNISLNITLIIAFLQFVQTSQVVMAGGLRGAGDTKFVASTMLLTVGILRPGVAYLMIKVANIGVYGAWVSTGFDMTLRMCLLMRRFTSGRWIENAMQRFSTSLA
ncbi:MAG: MATE family efflux transporter, partial [Oscillospiraceae bacterium]|nr:MATE family efflux transporter [Oscillospiraceae bacterium]